MSGRGSRHSASYSPPRRDGRVRCDPAFENFVPADQPAVMRGAKSAHARDEVTLQRGLIGHTQLAHSCLDAWRCLPLVLGGLVAAYMDVLTGEELHNFRQNIFQKLECILVDIVQVGIYTPV